MKPILLDLFCCQGGAAAGYADAGFEVFGIDKDPQPLYPFWFHQGDVLEVLDTLRGGVGVWFEHPDGRRRLLFANQIAARHASPPCQALSTITPDRSKHVNLIPAVRERLRLAGKPWVIENVEGAKREMVDPIRLCGSAFGMRVRRHRLFESSIALEPSVCRHAEQGTPVGVYGALRTRHWARPSGQSRGQKATSVEEARLVMGMPWADWHGCTQAIPPAYTEYIGRQLLAAVAETEAAA